MLAKFAAIAALAAGISFGAGAIIGRHHRHCNPALRADYARAAAEIARELYVNPNTNLEGCLR